VNGSLPLDDRTFRVLLRFPCVLLNHADSLNDHLELGWENLEHLAGGSTVVAGDDFDFIPLGDVCFDSTAIHGETGD
jgi:hypothetical protein